MLTVSDNHIVLGGGGGGGGGSGDVVGPASSTDNAIARFDGTTGKQLQNSVVTIGDNGAITSPAGAVIGGDPSTNEILKMGEKDAKIRHLSFQNGANYQIRVNLHGDNATKDVPTDYALIAAFDARSTGGGTGYTFYKADPGSSALSMVFNIALDGSARFYHSLRVSTLIDSTGSAGTNGQVLKNVAGLPVWSNP